MAGLPEPGTFAQIRDHLNQVISAQESPKPIRAILKKHRNLVARLYRASIEETRGPTQQDDLDDEFADVVIGDGPDQARAQILATVLSLQVEPLSELWRSLVSALALANPHDRDVKLRDEALPYFTLKYIEQQLGHDYASRFDSQRYIVCPPSTDSSLEQKLGDLCDCVEEARCSYMTKEPLDSVSESTGHFWPEGSALKLVETNRNLVQSIDVEYLKGSDNYRQADPVERGHALRKRYERADHFFSGVCERAKILAILLWSGASRGDQVWDLFVEACAATGEAGDKMLDTQLPHTPDSIRVVFGSETPQRVLDSFYNTQYAFCPVQIYAPRAEMSMDISLAHAHFPFQEKLHCGNGSSSDVYRVRIYPGHLQDEDTEAWYQEPKTLAMKVMKFDKDANRDVQVNNLIHKQAFKHNHIVVMRGLVVLQDAMLIFMEAAECNLYEHMTERCKSPAKTITVAIQRLQMLLHIADAMTNLHKNLKDDLRKVDFIHKDLKAENLLVVASSNASASQEERILKLTDFGLSSIKIESSNAEQGGQRSGGVQREKSSTTRQPENTPHFAPESRHNHRVTSKSDVWAFGTGLVEVLVWIAKGADGLLAFGQSHNGKAFWECDENDDAYLSPSIEEWFRSASVADDVTPDIKSLLDDCWVLLSRVVLVCNPDERGSMELVRDLLSRVCARSNRIQEIIILQSRLSNSDSASTEQPERLPPLERRSTTPTSHTDRDRQDSVIGKVDSGDITRQRFIKSLQDLATAGKASKIQRLLASVADKSDIDVPDDSGMSSLFCALRGSHAQAALELLRQGASVNAIPGNSKTPLHYVFERPPEEDGIEELVKMLLGLDSSMLQRTDSEGKTALHILAAFAMNDSAAIVEEMFGVIGQVARDKAVRVQDRDGKLPWQLIRASMLSSKEHARLRSLLKPYD